MYCEKSRKRISFTYEKNTINMYMFLRISAKIQFQRRVHSLIEYVHITYYNLYRSQNLSHVSRNLSCMSNDETRGSTFYIKKYIRFSAKPDATFIIYMKIYANIQRTDFPFFAKPFRWLVHSFMLVLLNIFSFAVH